MSKRKALGELTYDISNGEDEPMVGDTRARQVSTSGNLINQYAVNRSGEFSFGFSSGSGQMGANPVNVPSPTTFGNGSVRQNIGDAQWKYTRNGITDSSDPSTADITEFKQGLRRLNQTFSSSVRTVISTNPEFSLVPLVKDYLQHSQMLLENFKGKMLSNGKENTAPTLSFKSLGEYFQNLEEFVSVVPSPLPPMPTQQQQHQIRNEFPSTDQLSGPVNQMKDSIKTATHHIANPGPQPTVQPTPPPVGVLEGLALRLKLLRPPPPQNVNPEPINLSVQAPQPQVAVQLASIVPTSASSEEDSNNEDGGKGADGADGDSDTGIDEDITDGDEVINVGPSPEIVPTSELDNNVIYTTRCKVFVIGSDKEYKDRGIGTLYLKKLPDVNKHQIVVRANNQLETVILNILLSKSLPLKKQSGKCIMTVDVQGAAGGKGGAKGVPTLIKVASEEVAQELLAELLKCQQQC